MKSTGLKRFLVITLSVMMLVSTVSPSMYGLSFAAEGEQLIEAETAANTVLSYTNADTEEVQKGKVDAYSITVTGEKDFAEGTSVYMSEIPKEEVKTYMQDLNSFLEQDLLSAKSVLPLMIDLFDADGNVVQPEQEANVVILLADVSKLKETFLYHQKEDGSWEKVAYQLFETNEGSSIEFTTDTFSPFIFVNETELKQPKEEEAVEEKKPEAVDEDKPEVDENDKKTETVEPKEDEKSDKEETSEEVNEPAKTSEKRDDVNVAGGKDATQSKVDDIEAISLYGEAAKEKDDAIDAFRDDLSMSRKDAKLAANELFDVKDAKGATRGEADEDVPRQADGSNIESISAKWITADTVDNDDDSFLYYRPVSDNPFDVRLQINYALSGEHNYEAGDIVITIPENIIRNRAGKYAGTVILPYPEDPSTKGDFNWKLIDGNYVLTNTKRMSAATKGYIQVGFDELVPHDLVDMEVSEDFDAYIEVTTHKGNTIALRSNKLSAQFDTEAKIVPNSVRKKQYGSIERVDASKIPASQRVPGEEEYILVGWYMWGAVTANTYYTMDIVDTIPQDAQVTNELKESDVHGFLIDATSEDGTVKEANNVYRGYRNGQTSYIYYKTAYPASQFQPNVEYTFHNSVEMIITEVDPPAEVTNANVQAVDPRLVTSGDAVAAPTWSYRLPEWDNPEGHFMVCKNGNDDKVGNNRTHHNSNSGSSFSDIHIWANLDPIDRWYGIYPSAMNDLNDGNDVNLSYTIDSIGYAMPWMFNAGSYSTDGEFAPRKSTNYTHPVTMVTEDTGVRLGNMDLNVFDDYTFVSIEFPKSPYVYTGTPKNINPDGTWTSVTAGDGTFEYKRDSNYSHYPDITLELFRGGVWEEYATVNWTTGEPIITLKTGEQITGGIVNVPSNTSNFRTKVTLQNTLGENNDNIISQAAIDYDIRPVIKLIDTEAVKARVEAGFAASNTPSMVLYNGVNMKAYDKDNTEIVSIDKEGHDVLYGYTTDISVYPSKSSKQSIKDADYVNRRVTIHYSAKVEERSVINDKKTYEQAVADGRLAAETHGVWRDLLPKGVTPDIDSIKLRDEDRIVRARTIEDYNGSGRILLIVEAELTPNPISYRAGVMTYYEDIPSISFDAWYDFDALTDYGKAIHNVISFESSNDELGTTDGYKGEYDNPNSESDQNVSTHLAFETEEEKGYMTDLNPDRDTPSFVYAGTTTTIDIISAARLSLQKDVMVNNNGRWDTGVFNSDRTDDSYWYNERSKADNEMLVWEGGVYAYKLRMMPDDETRGKDLIVYDSLETFKAGDGNEPIDEMAANANATWQGKFRSVDVSQLEEKGCAPVVYYSTIANLALSDESDPNQGNPANMLYRANGTLNTSVWTKASDYTGDPGDVTAIAVDASKKADGSDFTLEPLESIVVLINMRAPSGQEARDIIANAGAWGTSAYAYNNAYLTGTTIDIDTLEEDGDNFVRKDYTKVGIMEYNYDIKKVWDDGNNRDGIRPESITVRLYADGEPTENTLEITADNHWTAAFKNIPYTTPDGTKIDYSIVEEPLNGYTTNILSTEHAATITNKHEPERISLNIHKNWVDDTEENRPEYITVELYGNGSKVASKRIDASTGWSCSFEDVYKNDRGVPIRYTAKEVFPNGDVKHLSYIANAPEGLVLTDALDVNVGPDFGDLLGLNNETEFSEEFINTYHPYGELMVIKDVTDVTDVSKEQEFSFTFNFTKMVDDEVVPVIKEYDYDILDANDEVISSGKVTDNSVVKIKGGQKIHVKEIDEYVTYKVEESEEEGFTAKGISNNIGTINPNQLYQARFENQYAATGRVNLNAYKKLLNRELRKYQFRFELYEVREVNGRVTEQLLKTGTSGTVNETATRDDGTIDYSTSTVSFGAIKYTQEDANIQAETGKPYRYKIVELNTNKSGYMYDTITYYVDVAVTDNGDGTLNVVPTYYKEVVEENNVFEDIIGAEPDTSYEEIERPDFVNEYKAKGEMTLRAWKDLVGRNLEDEEFEFELLDEQGLPVYKADPETGEPTSEPMTAKNSSDGSIVFDTLYFDENDIGLTFHYAIREKTGSDETVNYDENVYGYSITVYDNGDGTLSFSQSPAKPIMGIRECQKCGGEGYIVDDDHPYFVQGRMMVESYSNTPFVGSGGSLAGPELQYYSFTVKDTSRLGTYGLDPSGCYYWDGGDGDVDEIIEAYNVAADMFELSGLYPTMGVYTVERNHILDSSVRVKRVDDNMWTARFGDVYYDLIRVNEEIAGLRWYLAKYSVCDECHGGDVILDPITTLIRYEVQGGNYTLLDPDDVAHDFVSAGTVNWQDEPGKSRMQDATYIGASEQLATIFRNYYDDECTIGEDNVAIYHLSYLYDTQSQGAVNSLYQLWYEPYHPDIIGWEVEDAELPVFKNTLKDGSLSVSKHVIDAENADPNQKFKFKVKLIGDNIEDKEFDYSLSQIEPFVTCIYNANGGGFDGGETNVLQYHVVGNNSNLSDGGYAEPTRDGYIFQGWYTDAECSDGNEFESETAVIENTIVYAKWVKLEGYVSYNGSNGVLTFFRDEPGKYNNLQVIGNTIYYTDVENSHYERASEVPWHDRYPTAVQVRDTFSPVSTAFWFSDQQRITSFDLEKLDTSNVTDMQSMFYSCYKYGITDLDVSGFDTSKVTNMSHMFHNCWYYTALDVSNFDTSNVTDMSSMFESCSALTALDLSSFDTSNVTDMSSMFRSCTSLATLYASESWAVTNVTSSNNMFYSCRRLPNFDSSIIDKTKAHYNEGGYLAYKSVSNSGSNSVNPAGASITHSKSLFDKAKDVDIFSKLGIVQNVYGAEDDIASGTFEGVDWRITREHELILGGYGMYVGEPQIFAGGGSAEIKMDPTEENDEFDSDWPWHAYASEIESVKIEGNVYAQTDPNDPEGSYFSARGMFSNLPNVRMIDLEGFVGHVEEVEGMFAYCPNLLEIRGFNLDTSRAEMMGYMFAGCLQLSMISGSNFVEIEDPEYGWIYYEPTFPVNMNSAVDVRYMFYGCEYLHHLRFDPAFCNTDNIFDMEYMFAFSGVDSLDLSNWGTSSLEHADYMFAHSEIRNIDLSGWDTHYTRSMSHMFDDCRYLEAVNLSGIDLTLYHDSWWGSITRDLSYMFYGCDRLMSVNLSNIEDSSGLINTAYMFAGCSNLEELDLSNFDMRNVTDNYNMFPQISNLKKITLGEYFSFYPGAFLYDPWDLPYGKTGKWVHENDLIEPRTSMDLRWEYYADLAGTWTWQQDVPLYTIVFENNNEAAGAMPQRQYATEQEAVLPLNAFHLPNYQFVKWVDGNGNEYENGGTIPAERYSADAVITLTAVFEPIDTTVNMVDGEFEFELYGNETATFDNIPAGTAYQVYEETPDGWVLVEQSNASGMIEPLETSQASFTNKYEPGTATAQFFGTKTLDGRAAEAGSYTFRLRETTTGASGVATMLINGEEQQVELPYEVTVSDGGFIQFPAIKYSFGDIGTHTYEIVEVNPDDETIDYDTHKEIVKVNVTGDVVDLNAETVIDEDGDGKIAFENKTKPGHLKISKRSDTVTDANADDVFTFKVTLNNANGQPFGENDDVRWYVERDGHLVTEGLSQSGRGVEEPSEEAQALRADFRKAVQTKFSLPTVKNNKNNSSVKSADEPTATELAGLSDAGNAYAVLTTEGDLIFFRSYEEYEYKDLRSFDPDVRESKYQDVTDIFGNHYRGFVFDRIENSPTAAPKFENSGDGYWFRDWIHNVYTAEGQVIRPSDFSWWFHQYSEIDSIDVSQFDISETPDVKWAFEMSPGHGYTYSGQTDQRAVTSLNVGGVFTTRNATNLEKFFYGLDGITKLDLRNIDVSNATNLNSMFVYCSSVTRLDLSNFNVLPNATMHDMFGHCDSLNTVVLGEGFRFNSGCRLPVPPAEYNGLWTKLETGDQYTVDDIAALSGTDEIAGTYVWDPGDAAMVAYDANGGYTTAGSQSIRQGAEDGSVVIPDASTTDCLHYVLNDEGEWNTEEDGSGTSFRAGETVLPSDPRYDDLVQFRKITKLYAQWETSSSRQYIVQHYQQKSDFSGYTLAKTEVLRGDEGASITPDVESYDGFVTPEPQTVTVRNDDSLIVTYYYDRITYSIHYDGNGATSGEMIDDGPIVLGLNHTLQKNTFAKEHTLFSGWNTKADGSGTSYVDEAEVKINAEHEDVVTLYAQWYDMNDVSANITGEITVQCRAGEDIIIPNLPAGTTYTIEEIDNPAGWSQSGVINTNGEIVANQTSEATVQNTYAGSGSIDVVVHKTLRDGDLTAGEFTFELYKVDANGYIGNSPIAVATNDDIDQLGTILNDDGEEVENLWVGTAPVIFKDIPLSQDDIGKPVTYAIREVIGRDMSTYYDEHYEYLTITTKDLGKGMLSADVEYDDDGALFENYKLPASLKLTKQVKDVTEAQLNDEFEFHIELFNKDGSPYTGEYELWQMNGNTNTVTEYAHSSNVADDGTKIEDHINNRCYPAVISIPGAESLHVNLQYVSPRGYFYVWDGAYNEVYTQTWSSTIGPYTNNRIKSYLGDNYTSLTSDEFDVPSDGVSFLYYSYKFTPAMYPPYTAKTNYGYYATITADTPYEKTMVSGNQTVHLKHDESVVLRGLPDGVTYEITESAKDGYNLVEMSGDTGTLNAGQVSEARFVNLGEEVPYEAEGQVRLSANKLLPGGTIKKDDGFVFELLDDKGNIIQSKNADEVGSSSSDITFDPIDYTEKDAAEPVKYDVQVMLMQSGKSTPEIVTLDPSDYDETTSEIFGTFNWDATEYADYNRSQVVISAVPKENKHSEYAQQTVVDMTGKDSVDFNFRDVTHYVGGEYHYTIREQRGSDENVVYDDAQYSAIVNVTDNGQGTLETKVRYEKAGEPVTKAEIINNRAYDVKIVKKDAISELPLPNAEFTVRAANGQYVRPEGGLGEEPASFVTGVGGEINLEQVLLGTYTLHEVRSPEGYVAADDIIFDVTEDGIVLNGEIVNEVLVLEEPEKHSISVSKTVTGNAASEEDTFNFYVDLSGDNVPDSVMIQTNDGDVPGEPESYSVAADGRITVTLRGGQSVIISEIPYGVRYEVTEQYANENGYTTTVTAERGSVDEHLVVSGDLTANEAISYVNERNSAVPTGTPYANMLLLLLLLTAIGGFVVFRKTRKKAV